MHEPHGQRKFGEHPPDVRRRSAVQQERTEAAMSLSDISFIEALFSAAHSRDRVQAVVFAYEVGLVRPGDHPPGR